MCKLKGNATEEVQSGNGLNSLGSEYVPIKGSFRHGNAPASSIKD